MQIKVKETRLIAYIWETTNNNRQRFFGGAGGCWGTDNELIYEQDIYSNGNRSGVFVWHVVYHVPQNAKLQSVAQTRNLVQEFCYLSMCRGYACRLSRTKRKNTQVRLFSNYYGLFVWGNGYFTGRNFKTELKPLTAWWWCERGGWTRLVLRSPTKLSPQPDFDLHHRCIN